MTTRNGDIPLKFLNIHSSISHKAIGKTVHSINKMWKVIQLDGIGPQN